MKKFLYIIAFLILGTAFNTKANPTDPTHHSFLKPQYKGVFTGNNLPDFIAVLKEAANGNKAYFQDPYIDERMAAHFEAVLGNDYPGSVSAVIDGMKWCPAEQFTGSIQMGMLTMDYKSTDWDPNWQPRTGEMLGLYGDKVLISSYCGNFARGQFIPPAPPQPAPKKEYHTDTVIHQASGSNLYLTIKTENINHNENMNTNTNSSIGATPIAFQPGHGGGGGYNGPQEMIIREKANGAQWVSAIGQGLTGIAQVKQAFFPATQNIRIFGNQQVSGNSDYGNYNRPYNTGRVYNNTDLNPPQQIITNGGSNRRFNTSSLSGILPEYRGNSYGSGGYNLEPIQSGGY